MESHPGRGLRRTRLHAGVLSTRSKPLSSGCVRRCLERPRALSPRFVRLPLDGQGGAGVGAPRAGQERAAARARSQARAAPGGRCPRRPGTGVGACVHPGCDAGGAVPHPCGAGPRHAFHALHLGAAGLRNGGRRWPRRAARRAPDRGARPRRGTGRARAPLLPGLRRLRRRGRARAGPRARLPSGSVLWRRS